MKATTIARKALYQRVWSEPVTKLSKEFGLSDVGFAKLCKRNDIPRPPRGFWARKAVGQKVKTDPLPNPEKDWEITITPTEHEIKDPRVRQEAEKELAEVITEDPIVVPESLRGAHHLVSQSLHAFEVVQKDECGLLHPPREGCLDVIVSRDSLRRALRIMDAIIKAMEARGYSVKLSGEAAHETVIEMMDVEVPFGIRENLVAKQEEIDSDLNTEGRYEFLHSRYRPKTVPTGDLRLEINPRGGYYSRDGSQHKWSDGKRGRIEDYLNKFIAGLIHVAALRREARLEEDRRERERQEEERRAEKREAARAAMWAKIEAERAKVEKLKQDAADWEESRQLRSYIAAARENAIKRGVPVEPGSEMANWLQWAENQADRIDPLKESPPSLLDEEVKYRPPERTRYW